MRKIAIILLIIAIILVGVYFYITNNPNGVEVETYEIKKGDVNRYVEETGTIKSRSNRKIYASTAGEIETVIVEVGDDVKVGDSLLKFDAEKIDLEIKSLEAQLEGLKASYKEAIKPIDEEKIAAADVKIESIKISLEEAKMQLENNEKLFIEGAISQDTYRAYRNKLSIEEKNLEIAQRELELLEKEVSQNIKDKYESDIKQLNYQIRILENSKEDLILEAPIDGIITELFIEEGSYSNPGIELIEIGGLDDLYVETDILASEIGDIEQGYIAEVSSEDYEIYAKGSVHKVYPKAFSKTSDLGIEQKRVTVEINIPKEIQPNLKIGYEIDTNILISSAKNVITIPKNSIFEIDKEKYVFVVDDNKAQLREISIGIEGEDMVHITSGLKEGQKIVISPSEEMEDGVSVKEVVKG